MTFDLDTEDGRREYAKDRAEGFRDGYNVVQWRRDYAKAKAKCIDGKYLLALQNNLANIRTITGEFD